MFNKLFIIISLFLVQTAIAFATVPYTCPQIKRQADQVSWKCLEQASSTLIYKGQLMSHVLLEQIDKIEQQLGERQDVFFIARAGSSLSGFDQLRSHDSNGNRVSLDEIFDFGASQLQRDFFSLPNNTFYLKNSRGDDLPYETVVSEVRRKISRKYIDKKRPKLQYSHAGILFRTTSGVWNIYHELMPCNEKKKAYLYQDTAMSGSSSFFLDKPHKYKALIVPLKRDIQKRIISTINKGEEFMMRGPVYNAMANPWQANTQNSNSFVLEMIESALIPLSQYNSLATDYKKAVRKRDQFLNYKLMQYGVRRLSVDQKRRIEKHDLEYKKVCRPDYKARKEFVKSYIANGFEPTKIVFDSSFSFRGGFKKFFKQTLEMMKVTFIPVVGEHMRPSKASYKDHMKLGIGEAVSVYSIWQYLDRNNLIHPAADSTLFEIPELNYATAKRLEPIIKSNITLFVNPQNQAKELSEFNAVLQKMKKNNR